MIVKQIKQKKKMNNISQYILVLDFQGNRQIINTQQITKTSVHKNNLDKVCFVDGTFIYVAEYIEYSASYMSLVYKLRQKFITPQITILNPVKINKTNKIYFISGDLYFDCYIQDQERYCYTLSYYDHASKIKRQTNFAMAFHEQKGILELETQLIDGLLQYWETPNLELKEKETLSKFIDSKKI